MVPAGYDETWPPDFQMQSQLRNPLRCVFGAVKACGGINVSDQKKSGARSWNRAPLTDRLLSANAADGDGVADGGGGDGGASAGPNRRKAASSRRNSGDDASGGDGGDGAYGDASGDA
jgi:hypothetical protein